MSEAKDVAPRNLCSPHTRAKCVAESYVGYIFLKWDSILVHGGKVLFLKQKRFFCQLL